MDQPRAIEALAALAQQRASTCFGGHPDEIAAGEIARACKVPHNTMSSQLAILSRAALVSGRRELSTACDRLPEEILRR